MNDQSRQHQAAEPTTSTPPPVRHRRRLLAPVLLLCAAIAVLVGGGAWWYLAGLSYVDETDARIVADMTAVSSRLGGWVVELPIGQGTVLRKGELVARVDDRETALRLQELRLELRSLEAEQSRLAAEIGMVDGQTRNRLESERARLAAASALTESLGVEHDFAREDYERATSLSQRGVISTRDRDRSRMAYLQAQQAHLRAKAEEAAVRSELGEAESDRQRLQVLRAQRERLDQEAAQLKVQIERTELELADRAVRSPLNGVVSKVFIAPGEYVTPGQRIALLHDPSDIWVEALVKETEIGRLRAGQPVDVHVDAYPDQRVTGRVERIGHAATSEFSLLPSPNPSGNFTKVTQRIPVRIGVEQIEGKLRPGMMVEVSIDVRGD